MEDRIRTPLMLCITGLALSMVRTVVYFFFIVLGWFPNALPSGAYELFGHGLSLLSLVAAALVVVGLAQMAVGKLGAPNATLTAWVAAAALGVSAVLDITPLVDALAHLLHSYALLGVLATFGDLAALLSTVAFGLCLREHAKSRGQRVDLLVFGAMGVSGVSLLVGVAVMHMGFGFRDTPSMLMLLAVCERGLLLGAVHTVMVARPGPAVGVGVQGGGYPIQGGAYPVQAMQSVPQGSAALGFLAGFFGGCIGLGLVLAFAKGPATKRGAGIGFACQTVVGIGLRAAAH